MKKTLSKIKNKPGKRVDSAALEGRENKVNVDNKQTQQRDKFQIYKVNIDSFRGTKGTARNDLSSPYDDNEKSTTTYEAYTTTSESEPDQRTTFSKQSAKKGFNKRDKTGKAADAEVCMTVPEGGRGNIRIVGNNNPGTSGSPTKQVGFAPLDAVYGTTPEVSSDEEEDIVIAKRNQPQVYRLGDQGNKVFVMGSNDKEDKSRQQYLSTDNEGNMSVPEKGNTTRKAGTKPTLAFPVFSVNIHTSQEDVSRKASNGKKETISQSPSSQLSRLKRHLLKDAEHKNTRDANESGKKNEIEAYYVDEKYTDTEDLRGHFEKLMNNRQNSYHNSNINQTLSKTQSHNKHEKSEPINDYTEAVKSMIESGITRPVIYVVDHKIRSALGQDQGNTEVEDENTLNIASTSSRRTLPLNRNIGKETSRKKPEICGSKIAVKKSKRSFLKSSIPKVCSASSKKKSPLSLCKADGNIQGSNSKTSKQYVIREIMVIPEDQVENFANIYSAQPLDYEIPEETVMLEEREIRLHNMNNGYADETDQQASSSSEKKESISKQIERNIPDRNSPIILDNNGRKPSSPCLYYSTTTVDVGSPTKNENNCNFTVESPNNRKPLPSDTSFTTRSYSKQDDGDITDDNKAISPTYDDVPSTIMIGPEAHKEIMEAIDASSGKSSIITLNTKISRKGGSGKRLVLGSKNSKGINSPTRPVSVVETINEEGYPEDFKRNFNNKRVHSIQFVSTDVTETTGNTGTDKSELFEIRREDDGQTVRNRDPNINRQITREIYRGNPTKVLAYPSMINNNNPLKHKSIKKVENDQKSPHEEQSLQKIDKNQKKPREESNLITSKSFSEPLIIEESQIGPNDSRNIIVKRKQKKVSGKKRRFIKNVKNPIITTPETMVYLGALPNTSYNVFFSPDQQYNKDENDAKKTKSETKTLSPIKSEKLIAQGPKAILIFVNKKTELNRNPFDGNVMYGDEDDRKRHKDKRDRGKGKDRDKGRGKDRGKYGKGRDDVSSARGKRGAGKGKSRGSDFDADSNIYGSRGGRSRNAEGDVDAEGVVVERSPSGNKVVEKHPCGCVKIKKFDPESGTSSEEITSAFCRLGSQCEISQSQKNKRLIKYGYGSEESGPGSTYKSRDSPRSPQLDIVIEGLVSKKPIKYQPPAPQMNGANLTGTLSIKTNRCNGVFNFYIDPRVKNYLCNNLRCATNNTRDYSTTYDSQNSQNYRSSTYS